MDDTAAYVGPSWRQILAHWHLIEADLQERYGIDVHDRDLMRARSWRWLRTRIEGLLQVPPQFLSDGRPVQQTRLAFVLMPIPDPPKTTT